MSVRNVLLSLAQVLADEAEQNPKFNARLERALEGFSGTSSSISQDGRRKGGRRNPAALDPVELARLGTPVLRDQLGLLSLEQLLDIVAQYGMDPGKLVMKWRDPERVIARIVELASARATKGDAFRAD